MRNVLVCTCSAFFVACAGGEMQTPAPTEPPYELPTPELVAIAPTEMALGDTVSVIGKDLVDSQHGTVALHLVGDFASQSGQRASFDQEVPLTFINRGQAKFEFGPNVIFSPTGDEIGTFTGKATLVNRRAAIDSGGDPESKTSGEIDTNLRVLPSVLVERLHSVDQNCQGTPKSTIAGTNLAIGASAIGIGQASDSRPLRFSFHIIAPQVVAQYVRNDWYSNWPIMPTAVGTPTDGVATLSTSITSGRAVFIDPTTREQVFQVNPPVSIAQSEYSEVKLYKLMTGAVMGPGPQTVTFVIEVDDGSGAHVQRSVSVDVYNQGEILPYNGNTKLVERYSAQLVSACFAGGDLGRDLTYTEGTAETRTRSMSYRWDTNTAASVGFQVSGGLPAGIFTVGGNAQLTWSQTFGEDVSASVSTEHHMGENITAHILPRYFGVCYRQTERVERAVDLVFHNACGQSAVVGQAVLTDWNWGFDIATGPNCPPPTNLPGPQVFPP